MKLIKLLIWMALTIVVAYLLTDIKVGEKTIKQNLDEFLQVKNTQELKDKAWGFAGHILEDYLSSKRAGSHPEKSTVKSESAKPVETPSQGIIKTETKVVEDQEKSEGIKPKDEDKLKDLLKDNR